LYFDNRFCNGEYVIIFDESQWFPQGGVGFFVTGRDSHAATDIEVVADDGVIFDNAQQADILCVDIDTVVFGQSDPDFKLAG